LPRCRNRSFSNSCGRYCKDSRSQCKASSVTFAPAAPPGTCARLRSAARGEQFGQTLMRAITIEKPTPKPRRM
jgi:hypothetical protein